MAKAAAKKAAPAKKAAVKKPAVAATSTTFDDPYSTAAFKKAIRTNTVKHKRVYTAVSGLDIEGKAEFLAAINVAHKKAKKKLMDNVEEINAAPATDANASADDLG